MAQLSDLLRLKQLVALCDAQHQLAIQEQGRASQEVSAAMRQRIAGETAVSEAEQAWQGMTQLGCLGPELAAAAGTTLVARADALHLAIDRETQAERALSVRDDARREARARLEQAGDVTAIARAKAQRAGDERLLATIEDRTAYWWRRT